MKETTSENVPPVKDLFLDWILEVKKDLHKRGSYWCPTLVTYPADARTLVLRQILQSNESNEGFPFFVAHTDKRSKKWQQLKENASCSLHFYCAKRKWQMRLEGTATLHDDDEFAESQWEQLSPRSQHIYALKNTPGEPTENPKAAYVFNDDSMAKQNFGVIKIQASLLESLQLERPDRTDYHVRARWNLETNKLTFLTP